MGKRSPSEDSDGSRERRRIVHAIADRVQDADARSVITCAATSPEANRGRRNGRGASTWDAGASHCQHACCPFPERPDLDKKMHMHRIQRSGPAREEVD